MNSTPMVKFRLWKNCGMDILFYISWSLLCTFIFTVFTVNILLCVNIKNKTGILLCTYQIVLMDPNHLKYFCENVVDSQTLIMEESSLFHVCADLDPAQAPCSLSLLDSQNSLWIMNVLVMHIARYSWCKGKHMSKTS